MIAYVNFSPPTDVQDRETGRRRICRPCVRHPLAFGRYFADPAAFRELQLRTGLIISGSTALQFLDRTTYEGADLDIYAMKEHAQAICD